MNNRYRWILLSALSIMAFIINVDYTAVNLALPPMVHDLQASFATIQWVLSGYVFAWAIFVIPAGEIIDKNSKSKICILGLVIFLIASIIAGLANSADILITARILQGIAGALYVPTIYALIFINFQEQERGKAIGMMSLGVGLGLAMGPVIGGVLLSLLSWRSIFFINIPLVLIAMLIIYATQNEESVPQKKISWPVIPYGLFTNAPFMGCLIGILLEQYGFSAIVVSTGLYLQKIMQFSALKSCLIYLSLTTLFGIIAAAGGAWVDRVGLKLPTVLGLLLMALGSALFVLVPLSENLVQICIVFAILGTGMGFAFAGLNTGVVKTVQQENIGVATSLFLVCALLGNTIGVTLTTLIYQQSGLISVLLILKQYVVLNHGVSNAMLMNSVLALFAMFCCGLLLKKKI